jgi:predicted phosphodiesterase
LYIEGLKKMTQNPIKTVVIGDIHGRTTWKEIVDGEQDADVVVFMGDYFDSRDRVAGAKQLQNFLDIIHWKLEVESLGKKEVVLLFGNHDFHYMPWYTREPYSGYLPYMASKYRKVLVSNLQHLTVAYAMGDVLFTHAGVSVEWLNRFAVKPDAVTPWLRLSAADIAKAINDTFAQFPKRFDFNGFNPFGDDPQQSPIWIRPWALEIANIARLNAGLVQVFGHTVPQDPQAVFQKSMENKGHKYFHADLLSHRMYLVLEGDTFLLKKSFTTTSP